MSYTLMPDDPQPINMLEVAAELSKRNDPVIDLIIHQMKLHHECWELFDRLYKGDPDNQDYLGIAKLSRVKRDCCAELLEDILNPDRRWEGDDEP